MGKPNQPSHLPLTSNQKIAAEQNIYKYTIVKYLGGIPDKVQLANRTQAALCVLRERLAR